MKGAINEGYGLANVVLFDHPLLYQFAGMCSQGWLVPSLSWRIIGFVWAYNLVWMIAQDVVKLGLYGVLDPARSWKRSIFQSLRVSTTREPEAIS